MDELETQMNAYRESIDEKELEAHANEVATQNNEDAVPEKTKGRKKKVPAKNATSAVVSKLAKRRVTPRLKRRPHPI